MRFSSRLMFLRGVGLGSPYLRSRVSSQWSHSFCASAVSGRKYGCLSAQRAQQRKGRWIGHVVRRPHWKQQQCIPEDQNLDQPHQAREDAEGTRLLDNVRISHVRLKLLVGVRLAAEGAHELDDGAVDERRLDLRGVLLALGKSWSPICTNAMLQNGTRRATWSVLKRVTLCVG